MANTPPQNIRNTVEFLDLIKKDPRLGKLPQEVLSDPELLRVAIYLSQSTDPSDQRMSDVAMFDAEMLRNLILISKRSPEFRAALGATVYLGMTVSDGSGKERGYVVIEIDWLGKNEQGAMLKLWKDTGTIRTTALEVEQSPTARLLDYERSGPKLRYVDVDVQNGRSYTYYAIVEASPNEQRYWFTFDKKTHVARFSESKEQYAERKISQVEIEERLRSATKRPDPVLPLEEFTEKVMKEIVAQKESIKRAEERLISILDASAYQHDEKQIIYAKVMQRILSELQRRTQ